MFSRLLSEMQETITKSRIYSLIYSIIQEELDNLYLILENIAKSVQVSMEEFCPPPNYLAPKVCISRDTAYVKLGPSSKDRG